jgi:hypothetical protein
MPNSNSPPASEILPLHAQPFGNVVDFFQELAIELAGGLRFEKHQCRHRDIQEKLVSAEPTRKNKVS